MTYCTEDVLHFENYWKRIEQKIENIIMCQWKPLERFEVCMEISKGMVLERPRKRADVDHQEKVSFYER